MTKMTAQMAAQTQLRVSGSIVADRLTLGAPLNRGAYSTVVRVFDCAWHLLSFRSFLLLI